MRGKILINYGLPLRLLIVKKVLWIIIGVLIGTVGTIVGVYVYTTQELIEAQFDNIDTLAYFALYLLGY
jgi:hypothetical protein